MVLREGDLELALPPGATGWKFDDEAVHGLSHCMKAVDFVIELPDCLLFVEIKDPQHPSSGPKDRDKFIGRFKAGGLDDDLKYKYRDSFLYQWACGNVGEKPIHYLVLIALDSLTEADLSARTDELRRQLPLDGPPSGVWLQPIVDGCMVFNVQTWNAHLPQYRITRASS